jgi:hypothetical protein
VPRGGWRPGSGRKPGSKNKVVRKAPGRKPGSKDRLVVGREAPPPPPALAAKLHALSEMRLAAGLLRNIMVKVHDDFLAGAPVLASREAIEFVSARILAYIRAQKEIVPYEDPKLATVTLQGDKDNPLRMVQELDLSKLTDEQLAIMEPILMAIQPKLNEAPETQH